MPDRAHPAAAAAAALLAALGASCAARPARLPAADAGAAACVVAAAAAAPAPDDAAVPADVAAAPAWLSPRSRAVADSVGAAPALAALERARTPVARLAARQEATERVLLALLDVTSTLAALDCEGERGDRLRGVLASAESARARRLGIASIALGAATAIATGGLAAAGASAANYVGIAGGSAEAAAGAALLVGGGASGELRHPNNLLRDAWERPRESSLFPPSVWRHLARPGADGRSELDELAATWRDDGLLGPPGTPEAARREALLFGPGGRYEVGDLEARDAMLDLLEARVALMSRDLRGLLGEIRAAAGALR